MKKTIYLIGILLTGIIGSFLVWLIGCCNCDGKSKSNAEHAEHKSVEKKIEYGYPFEIKDADHGLNYVSQDNFNFLEGNSNFVTPVSNNVVVGVDKLKSYLETDSKRIVDVTGLYSSNEVNTTAFPNLGLARANSVKNYLVSKGIDSKSINLKSKLSDDLTKRDSLYVGPITYNVSEIDVEQEKAIEKELEVMHNHIIADPLLLYFDFGDSTLNFNNAQRLKIQEIVTYTDKNHQSVVDIIGHSDSVGNVASNTKLGLDRANYVKDYLVNIGINPSQIKVSSEGPNKPIATNETPEGRAKNRRVEVILE